MFECFVAKHLPLMIYIFCRWNPSVMEAVRASLGCCFNYPIDWIANDWFFHDESYFKLSISTFRCLISLFSLSSSVWFIDELHLDGSFPWLFLMLNDISCSIVALCWVVVDIIVFLDFFSWSVFLVYILICHNTILSCFLVRYIFFLNF